MRRNKYNNIKTYIDGIKFDSKKEAVRYQDLKLMEKGKIITDLQLQYKFKFPPGFAYIADFLYKENGQWIAEDVKGVQTAVFRLKKKCMEYFFENIDLRIV